MQSLKTTLLTLFVLSGSLSIGQQVTPSPARFANEIAAFKARDKEAPPAKGKILFVGSSSFRMWKTLEEDFPEYNLLNRGFGGSNLSDVIYFFHDIVVPYQPAQIVVYEGDNDIFGGMTPELFMEDVVTFSRMVELYMPGTPVLFLSVKPSPARSATLPNYRRANQMLYEFALSKNHVRYVDVFQLMIDEEGHAVESYFTGDMLHMNRSGYELWTELLRPWLSEAALKLQ